MKDEEKETIEIAEDKDEHGNTQTVRFFFLCENTMVARVAYPVFAQENEETVIRWAVTPI